MEEETSRLDSSRAMGPGLGHDGRRPTRRDDGGQASGSDTDVYRGRYSPRPRYRRRTRAATFGSINDSDEMDILSSAPPGWQPGSEPGYDPDLPDGGHASMPTLNAPCDITVFDFSLERLERRHFDNQPFISFLERPREEWARCRWINVNGLSWDVLQAIGARKGLHKLALEDVMNVRNRTKAEWYVCWLVYVSDTLSCCHDVEGESSIYSARRWMLQRADTLY